MLRGMFVIHEGRVKQVTAIQGDNPAPGITPTPVLYTLQEPGSTRLEWLNSPAAVNVPLLPACPTHGPSASPGQYGSPGWACRPDCPVSLTDRAALQEVTDA